MTELTVSCSVEIMRTPASSPQSPYPQGMLLPGTGASDVLCTGSCCGRLEQEGTSVGAWAWSSVMVQFLLLVGPMAGMLSQCGWYREEPVSLASARDSWWLCQQTSPQHPGEDSAFHHQVTFRSAGGRGRAQKQSPWGDERFKATGLLSQVSSCVTPQQGPLC